MSTLSIANADRAGLMGPQHVAQLGSIVTLQVQVVAATGAAETLDTAAYTVFDLTLDDDCTLTIGAPASGIMVRQVLLYLRQDGSGGHTITYPGTVLWPGGSDHALTPAASALDAVSLLTIDGGTNWIGTVVGQGFA